MNKPLIQEVIRFWFDSLKDRYRGELQRQEAEKEIIEQAYELELETEFIEGLLKDHKSKL